MTSEQVKFVEQEEDREENASLLRLVLRGIWRPLFVVGIIAMIIVIVKPARLVHELSEVRDWIRDLGVWGILLFLAIYIVAAVAIVPQSVLKVAAGGIFGSVLGVVVASIGSTLGAAACFVVARYVAKGSLMRYVRQRRQVQRLDRLTIRHGALFVVLSRLIPVLPGNLVNYAFGLTRVRFETYVLWSWLGMLPATVVLVVGTDAFVDGVAEGRIPWAQLSVVAGALVILGAAAFIAHRRFRQSSAAVTSDAGDSEFEVASD